MSKKIVREVEVMCTDCHGSGVRCETCGGVGKIKRLVIEIVHEELKLESK